MLREVYSSYIFSFIQWQYDSNDTAAHTALHH